MRVEIKEGGDGVACWNAAAVQRHADASTATEDHISAANPDVRVIEGSIRCYGCEVQEYHYGTKCTAMLTKTLYVVRDQIGPRTADAAGSLLEIDGLKTIEPGSKGLGSHNAPVDAATAPVPAETGSGGDGRVAQEPPDREPRKSGLRGIFGRSGS
ncbi:MAG: hypothetical protein ACR2LI_09115 [Propionibacteriaceae bacterium]